MNALSVCVNFGRAQRRRPERKSPNFFTGRHPLFLGQQLLRCIVLGVHLDYAGERLLSGSGDGTLQVAHAGCVMLPVEGRDLAGTGTIMTVRIPWILGVVILVRGLGSLAFGSALRPCNF